MKKILILYLIMQSIFTDYIHAEVGCMDNSKHINTNDGYDYKKYRHVYCTCPCYRYKQSFKRGRCEKCLHYRAPQKIEFIARNQNTSLR